MPKILGLALKLSSRPMTSSAFSISDPAGSYPGDQGSGADYTYRVTDLRPTSVILDDTVAKIKMTGVAANVSSIELYWRRPGVVEDATSIGLMTDDGGGIWTFSAWDAIITEQSTLHGAFPWTDIDFSFKVVSPSGVKYIAWQDVTLNKPTYVPDTSTIDPTLEGDCTTPQVAVAYGFDSTEIAAQDWVPDCCDPQGTIQYRFDYEGKWATGNQNFVQGTYTGGDVFQIFIDSALVAVRSDTYSVNLTHGLLDDARWQIKLEIMVHTTPVVTKLYKRDPVLGLALDDDTSWTLVTSGSDGADDGSYLKVTNAMGVGKTTGGAPHLTGIMRAWKMGVCSEEGEDDFGWLGQAHSEFRLNDALFDGTQDSTADDTTAVEWILKLVGGAGVTVCWQS